MKLKKYKVGILASLAAVLMATSAQATPTLFDWAFNIDGVTYESGAGYPGSPVGTVTGLTEGGAGFDGVTGLGDLILSITGAGAHSFTAFFDHEIDEDVNTWFNEYGSTGGALAAGQSWEIDEPGYVFGDIYGNALAGSLDNSNGVSDVAPEDVSMSLGWGFNLLAGQTATITLSLSDILPAGGFYLAQNDPASNYAIYLTSALDITGGGVDPIPEPATMLLMGTGLAGLCGFGRRKFGRA